jgi:hypothetical protein
MRWVILLCVALLGCAGKGAGTGGEKKADLDADPIALLPAGAVVVANLDARALIDHGPLGGDLARLASRVVPVGEEAGFQPARDVDRLVIATYATGGADFAVVLSGRFDEAKIAAITKGADGTPIVRGVYAEHTTYTAGPVAYAVLTPKTVVSGSGDGLRRVLERVKGGALDRSVPPWMVETLQTKGAPVALAADFSSQPIAVAAVGTLNLGWLKALRVARVIGNFEPPGMNVAATLTYADAQQAQAAVEGVHVVEGWVNVLGPALGGIRLQNLQATTDAQDLRCKFAIDDQSLRAMIALLGRFLPAPP